MQTKTLQKLVIAAVEELKATEIVSIDVRKISSVTDLMVVCTGRSTRHVKSIADNLLVRLKEKGIPSLSSQGLTEGEWVLVDFGSVVAHIMLPEVRAFYALEKLWNTPKQIRTSSKKSGEAEKDISASDK